ncbi:MAG: hypothetical protein RLZZ283_507, partial [Candidatus Parcubacteria bacterium]
RNREHWWDIVQDTKRKFPKQLDSKVIHIDRARVARGRLQNVDKNGKSYREMRGLVASMIRNQRQVAASHPEGRTLFRY